MNIEEAIKRVQEIKKEYATMDGLKDYVLAIETLLKAYEKEKEKNKELIKQHAIEITDVDGNSIKIDLDGKIHNVYKIKEE